MLARRSRCMFLRIWKLERECKWDCPKNEWRNAENGSVGRERDNGTQTMDSHDGK
jgi:hypothetical protein